MSTPGLWRQYQDWLYYDPRLELYLDLSRMRLRAGDLATHEAALRKALSDMAALEAGAIANPDESRMVGHYWLRASGLAPTAALRAAIEADIAQVAALARSVHDGSLMAPLGEAFSDVLCIGIGGSVLGPQLLARALVAGRPQLAIHFLDNTDPDGIESTLVALAARLASTLVIVTSKSGSTPETRNGMLAAEAFFAQAGLTMASQAVAVTGVGSALDDLARSSGWLARFPMHDWVGGRTSVTSAVGLLPAALQGIDIRGLLDGARLMDEATRGADIRRNPAALMALAWYEAGQGVGARDMVVLPYRDRLELLGRYLQQLVMESLGKARDLKGDTVHQGMVVYGNKGSTDQHAYVQQLRDGPDNFFVTFVEALADDGGALEVEPGITSGDYLFGFLEGTRQALHDSGRRSLTVTLPRVDARSVGALIALFERSVGLYASMINVNAYHQPGVEAGKRAAARFLELKRRLVATLAGLTAAVSIEQLAQAAGIDDMEAVYKIVRHLEASGKGISLSGNRSRPAQLVVQTDN